MSADIRRLFPEGLKPSVCERGKPRHEPPLRFAPPALPSAEEGEDDYNKTISVELSEKTTTKIVPHVFRTVEDFLVYQKNHDYVLLQQDSQGIWNKYQLLLTAAQAAMDAISPNSINKEHKKQRKKHKESITLMSKRMDTLISKAFGLYQQMSASALRQEWDAIVQDHCFSTGWPLPDGTPSTLQRGQDWTTLTDCKRLHLLTVCDKDASERNTAYMNSTLRKPPDLSIKYFHKRCAEMDKLAPCLPCLKDQPDCPPGVERNNVSMTPFAMCNLLMRNVTPKMEDEYNCLHDTVPTDPKKLVEQLTKIETKLRTISNEQRTVQRQLNGKVPEDPHRRSRGKVKRPNANGNGRDDTDKQPIPRKQFTKAPEQHCKLCKEYGGQAKSHSTAQCKKWVAGGKSHHEWRGTKTANINVHTGDNNVNQLMAQQAEINKSMMKQLKSLGSKKKKRSKRRRRDSDSDSSDSDS
jgi:hypothetical protein